MLLTAAATILHCTVGPDSRPNPPDPPPTVQLAPALGGLRFEEPVAVQFLDDIALIVEKPGRIVLVREDAVAWTKSEFLDISDRVNDSGNEEGLLGIALPQDFSDSGKFYVYYTAADPRRSVVSRFSVDRDDSDAADPTSETILLEVEQPYRNHNGGQIAFGPDGYLYIGLGDGGSGGDPRNNGQDLGTLLGAILRIDVAETNSGLPYTIPDNNPFVGRPGARPEIWAYGLRNPWRFSFDRATGTMWAGDVGQNKREEVNVIIPGANYGWNLLEGSTCFRNSPDDCEREGLTAPVLEYGHDLGCSVTGGYVYRGESIPGLLGHYVYGDFCSGKIWAFSHDSGAVELLDTTHGISTFGEDHNREIYVVSLSGSIDVLTR